MKFLLYPKTILGVKAYGIKLLSGVQTYEVTAAFTNVYFKNNFQSTNVGSAIFDRFH